MSIVKRTWRSLRVAAVAAGLLGLAATGTAAEKRQGPEKPLVFKSRVINAPEAANQVRSVVADVLREAYTDPKTGKPRTLSAQQRSQLKARLERAFKLNRSSDGLAVSKSASGTESVDLQGRFQYIYLSRTNPDGTVTTVCVSDWESAEAFLSGAGASDSDRR